mmetsp:Transcript_13105/g.15147  ORF Transcript_13105/g.15147 Transcript_13105/m.15147 type:complete len:248 (-) Transcript_13105:98-841(-)
MNRESLLFKNLEQYLQTYKADRSNKELIDIYNREEGCSISQDLLIRLIDKKLKLFSNFESGRCYDFVSIGISDINAEYIRLPKDETTRWVKKAAISFMFNTSLHEYYKSIYVLDENMISNMFSGVFLPEEVVQDYTSAFRIRALHVTSEKEPRFIERVATDEIIENTRKANELIEKARLPAYFVKNQRFLTMTEQKVLENKSMGRISLSDMSYQRMRFLEGVLINRVELERFEYNCMLMFAQQEMET